MASWHDDDAFWRVIEPALFTKQRFATATTDVESIIELLALRPGARILDLCCGPGRHAVELARRGFRVTGVDRMASFLERARAQAARWEVELELVEADMRAFSRPGAFDAIVNLFTSFGYFADERENERVLANMHRSLTDGGVALIEILGKEAVARRWQERTWNELDDGTLVCEERVVADGWERLDSRWIVVRPDGTRGSFTGTQRIYSAREMREMLGRAGFADVAVYGTLRGGPYVGDVDRLVAVARR